MALYWIMVFTVFFLNRGIRAALVFSKGIVSGMRMNCRKCNFTINHKCDTRRRKYAQDSRKESFVEASNPLLSSIS
jgi:hypothetical protein